MTCCMFDRGLKNNRQYTLQCMRHTLCLHKTSVINIKWLHTWEMRALTRNYFYIYIYKSLGGGDDGDKIQLFGATHTNSQIVCHNHIQIVLNFFNIFSSNIRTICRKKKCQQKPKHARPFIHSTMTGNRMFWSKVQLAFELNFVWMCLAFDLFCWLGVFGFWSFEVRFDSENLNDSHLKETRTFYKCYGLLYNTKGYTIRIYVYIQT